MAPPVALVYESAMDEPPSSEGTEPRPGGHHLYWRAVAPPQPRAAVLVLHGLAEHSGRYLHVLQALAGRGYAALAPDLRAHGRSSGARVHVSSFSEFVDDAEVAFGLLEARHPGLPAFVLAHSHGGLVALRWLLERPLPLCGLVLTSPFLASHPARRLARPLRAAVRVLDRVWPSLRVPSGLAASSVSRDPAVVAAYAADPLVSTRVSPRWYVEASRAQAHVRELMRRLPVPTLLVLAGDDRLVDAAEALRVAATAPRGTVQVREWPGLSHEVMNEPEKEAVLGEVLDWMDARRSAQRS